MSKILPFFRAIQSPTIARQMVGIFHATHPETAFLSPTYLKSIGIENLDFHERFNGYDSCHHASELLFYLLKRSGFELDLKFVNFRRQTHCFLTSEDGKTIIDPTWKQFFSPQELLKSITALQYDSAEYRGEYQKFCDFSRVDKAALRDVELGLMSESAIFVGSPEEMDERFCDFIKRFNKAYEISSSGFDQEIFNHTKSYYFPKDSLKWQAAPMLQYYVDKTMPPPARFAKFAEEIFKTMQNSSQSSQQVAQPLAQKLQDLKSQNFSQDR